MDVFRVVYKYVRADNEYVWAKPEPEVTKKQSQLQEPALPFVNQEPRDNLTSELQKRFFRSLES